MFFLGGHSCSADSGGPLFGRCSAPEGSCSGDGRRSRIYKNLSFQRAPDSKISCSGDARRGGARLRAEALRQASHG